MKKLSATVKGLLAAAQNSKTKSEVSDLYLELVAKYEDWLAESTTAAPGNGSDEQIAAVLEDLCTQGPPFWFKSAAVWFTEEHQDRGTILVPGPRFSFSSANKNQKGIAYTTEICEAGAPLLLRSTKDGDFGSNSVQGFDAGPDTPAAFVPLRKGDRSVGLLTLFGAPVGPLPSRQDGLFLRALGSVIINNVSQQNSRSHSSALAEMDNLFVCNSLDELWPLATSIMKRYLSAAGCMIVFRPNPSEPQMEIVSVAGFGQTIWKSKYRVGLGQTGRCAETGQPCRIDDVSLHQSDFDSELLQSLERAHGQNIHSWMAIPIGEGSLNYGAIKVINRTTRPGWFTDDDQWLGLSLALRLRIIIEKFIHINRIEIATQKALSRSVAARQQAEMAQQVARQRQDDLMVITHQLQGPLSSMLGSISYLKWGLLRKDELRLPASLYRNLEEQLTNLEDFASDTLTLTYGISTTFALEAGQKASFGFEYIDAIEQLKHLAKRLQKTNARDDLNFYFRKAVDFPSVWMDPNVFISVFYTLIHNAMKYADSHSEVTLECGFERGKEAALKVKSIGEPILPSEREFIFEQFGRGRIIRSFGRHHSGVGLGLWVARTLMRAVGGDLTVELSPTEPKLSVFVVHLPQT